VSVRDIRIESISAWERGLGLHVLRAGPGKSSSTFQKFCERVDVWHCPLCSTTVAQTRGKEKRKSIPDAVNEVTLAGTRGEKGNRKSRRKYCKKVNESTWDQKKEGNRP